MKDEERSRRDQGIIHDLFIHQHSHSEEDTPETPRTSDAS